MSSPSRQGGAAVVGAAIDPAKCAAFTLGKLMNHTYASTVPATAARSTARVRARAWRLLLAGALAWIPACVLAASPGSDGQPGVVHSPEPMHAATIRRQLFSTDTFAEAQSEFGQMKVMFAEPLREPAERGTSRAMGIGPSGLPSHFAVDRVSGRFHAYAERHRPQHPVGALPYVAHEVVFETPDPGVAPVGTLSYPASGAPFPAIVLVAGSGPHTRDAGMSLHKTLVVLADHLTRQGFAVLRYDKRGVGLTGGAVHPGSTTDDYAADALAALHFLQRQPNVDARRVGLVGHSEGGIIAAMVAAEAPADVAFIVMLAGTGLPGIDVKSLQDAAARRVEGMPEPLVLLNRSQERELFEIAAGPLDHVQAMAAMASATEALPPETRAALEVPAEGIPSHAYEDLLTPWFRRFLQLDPRSYLAKVRCPVLALVGDKDLQVPAPENLDGIRRALAPAANPRSSVRQLPGINHALQTARTGSASEYFLIEQTVAPAVLDPMSAWLLDVVGGEG